MALALREKSAPPTSRAGTQPATRKNMQTGLLIRTRSGTRAQEVDPAAFLCKRFTSPVAKICRPVYISFHPNTHRPPPGGGNLNACTREVDQTDFSRSGQPPDVARGVNMQTDLQIRSHPRVPVHRKSTQPTSCASPQRSNMQTGLQIYGARSPQMSVRPVDSLYGR
nr:hypothetical protein KitaXyl93_17420 [Kitasatospora sp. Xyl93]